MADVDATDRAAALVKWIAQQGIGNLPYIYAEARSIAAALEPVDPDMEAAEAIIKAIGYCDIDPASDVLKVALAAIKCGRQLESEGRTA